MLNYFGRQHLHLQYYQFYRYIGEWGVLFLLLFSSPILVDVRFENKIVLYAQP